MMVKNNKKTYWKDLYYDPYLKSFLHNLDLCYSCYDCRFKTIKHVSDITLTDLWRTSNPGILNEDDKGVSLK